MSKAGDNSRESADATKARRQIIIKRDQNVPSSAAAGTEAADDEDVNRGTDKQKRGTRSPESAPQNGSRAKRLDASSTNQPTFYFGGKNGESIVETILTELGWKRVQDKNASNTKLRWTECKGAINYADFREGEQLVNHIPNCELLTNKLGLLMSLREHERSSTKNKSRLRFSDFHPETYVLDDKAELEMFYQTFKPGEIWICKPTGLNQGIGIYLVRDLDQFKQEWNAKLEKEKEKDSDNPVRRKPKNRGRIIQRYIMQPLLVDDRKFDIRCYVLIACTVPYLVLFHNGYLRLSIYKYNTDVQDLTVHLTNQYIQKKDPVYKTVKNDTVWSMEKFNEYINANLASQSGVGRDWVWNMLVPRIKQIAGHVFSSVRGKFASRVGYFELFGLDFMIDKDMKVWLIEINTNPSLSTNCEVLKDVIPPAVTEGVHIVLESFEKSRRRQQIMPLQTLKTWEVVFQGPTGAGSSGGNSFGSTIRYSPPLRRKSATSSPERSPNDLSHSVVQPIRARNISPVGLNASTRRGPNAGGAGSFSTQNSVSGSQRLASNRTNLSKSETQGQGYVKYRLSSFSPNVRSNSKQPATTIESEQEAYSTSQEFPESAEA